VKLNIEGIFMNRILVLVAIILFYATTAFSAVPQIINYQGSLSDSGGAPINATLNMTFTLYDVASGPGTTLWLEVQSVDVVNGVFQVQLGADAGNPLNATILDDPIFLGVAVDTDAEMTPRQRVTSAAFAIRSQTVENDTLNSLSCSNGEVPKWNGSAWACAADDEGAGDITGVTTSNGITGGGTSGDIDIGADRNILQARVSDTCPAGQSIRVINDDGTVTCEVDTDTTYSTGSGLTLNGTVLSVPTNGIDASHLAPDSVGASEIADNSVGTGELVNGGVSLNDLNDNAKGVGVNGSIIVHASEFQPVQGSNNYALPFVGYITPGSTNATVCLVAPVNIPHGVTISQFEISAWDNAAILSVSMTLQGMAFSSGTVFPMANASTSGSSPSVRVFSDNTIQNGTVNGFLFTYFVTGCINSDAVAPNNTRLYAVRVRYN